MSITFWCPQAPTKRFVPYPEDEPDYEETRSTLPEVNLSNSSAPRHSSPQPSTACPRARAKTWPRCCA